MEITMKVIIVFLLTIWMSATVFAQDQNDNGTKPGSVGTPLQVQTGSRPVPDPTLLTAQALASLREEMSKWIELRFADVQKQVDRNQLRLDQIPDALSKALGEAEKLTAEKFKGLADQQVQRDNNLALALTAAQKSVSDTNLSTAEAARKAENTFKDQISATQKIIDGLNDRVTRIESASSGAGGAVNWVIAGIGVFSVLIGIGISLFAIFKPSVPIPLPVVTYAEPTFSNGRRKS
jgi:flagellar biosynthesis regulator FlaF